MIKKFIAKNMVGIPDVELEFDDSKIIVIKGPNGSGKTSLLRQITHPFASHDRINRLRTGEDSGYTISYITFNNIDYKIQHLYERDRKGNVKVNSYLSKKINDTYEELVENGLPTNFNRVVQYEFEYEKYLYDILNVGVNNKGIVESTNNDRIEYMKKLLKINKLNEMKENVLAKISEYNGSLKFVKAKLADFTSINDLVNNINDNKSDIAKIESILKDIDNKINNLVRDENIDTRKLEEDIINKNNNITELKAILNILDDDSITYNELKDILKENILKYKNIININDNKLDEINSKYINIREVNMDKLNEEKDELIRSNELILTKYSNYKSIDIDNINEIKDYLIKVKDILLFDENISINTVKMILSDYKNPNEYVDILIKDIDNYENEIRDISNKINNLDVSKNLVKLSIPSKCMINTCELRMEYERQVESLERSINFKNILTNYNNTLEEYKKELPIRKINTKASSNILNIKIPNNIGKLLNRVFPKYINIQDISRGIEESIKELSYLDDMDIVKKANERINEIESNIKINIEKDNNYKNSLKEEMNKLDNIIKSAKIELSKYEDKLDSIDININDYNNTYKNKGEIIALINKLNNEIKELNDKIIRVNDIEKAYNDLNLSKEENNIKLDKLKEDFNKNKNDLINVNNLTKEFDKITSELEDSKLIRNIVSTRLPGRIIQDYLEKASNFVNEVIGDFLTIRFDVSEGINIIVTREGIDRYIDQCSQGEKSIICMALLLVFKQNIKWDIISLDELDATLDEDNKSKFIYLIRDFSETINNLSQIFIVTHTEFEDDGMDIMYINL